MTTHRITSSPFEDKLVELDHELLPHPLYSPNLAWYCLISLPNLKEALVAQEFESPPQPTLKISKKRIFQTNLRIWRIAGPSASNKWAFLKKTSPFLNIFVPTLEVKYLLCQQFKRSVLAFRQEVLAVLLRILTVLKRDKTSISCTQMRLGTYF